ncbi:MAG TPA: C4-type zinc ribbon domain-containing protein [Dehalococcoidia bacterium]|nr:C4-type zinc ribbon domain-containing protein [Dehalococcoidia bacterium]
MTRVSNLYALQEIDSQIDSCERALSDVRARQGEDEGQAQRRERIAELEPLLLSAAHEQREAETEVEDLRAKIAPVEEKLYSGRITSAKELQDLQGEVDQFRRQLQGREERLLLAMGRSDELQGELDTLRREVVDGETAWLAEQGELAEQADRLTQEIAALHERSEQARRPIDGEALRRYDQLRRSRQGRAVARVQGGTCLGCRIALPSTLFQRARSGMALVSCSNCERILYVG